MDAELFRQATILFGASIAPPPEADPRDAPIASPADAPKAEIRNLRVSPRQERRLWRHVESIEDFWETLSEIEPTIVERLATLATERRWELIFLTKRQATAGASPQVQSQRWLEAKGFRRPSVYVVRGSRGRIAAALDLDVVVDDRPESCLDVVVDSKARAILIWRGDEARLPVAGRRLGIEIVPSVAACLDLLVRIDSPVEHASGVVARVRRLLGRKQPASA